MSTPKKTIPSVKAPVKKVVAKPATKSAVKTAPKAVAKKAPAKKVTVMKTPAKPMSEKKVAEVLGTSKDKIITTGEPVSVSEVKVEVAKKKAPATPMKELAKVAPKPVAKPVAKMTSTPVVKVEVVKKEATPGPKKSTITMSELTTMMQKSISAVAAK